jgi:hypothetical protein
MRIRDLGLRIERSPVARSVRRLYRELDDRGLRFRPHVWFSTEWFAPDGIPGIAIPFYLGHPRLARLEARQMLQVEGTNASDCMRFLRHEAGHAIGTAFRLHLRRSWREMFGRWSKPYPEYYSPQPGSRRYVLHLGLWYAQAHPAEDFAETFAVWLTPRSRWRAVYRDWPVALSKLRYVDSVMREVAGRRPAVRSRARVEPVSCVGMTLREYYARKRERYAPHWPDIYDRDLRRIFSDDPRYRNRPAAAGFLRGLRPRIRETVATWTGTHTYTIDQVLQDMIERCRALRLRLTLPPARAKTEATLLLTVHTLNRLHVVRQEIPL